MATIQSLNNYIGTDDNGNVTTIVAEDMETACKVYADQLNEDPMLMQCTKKNIRCVLPTTYVTFTTEVYDTTGIAKTVCKATPETYTVAVGTKVIFTAIPAEGWRFSKWLIDDVEASTDEVAQLTIPANDSGIVKVRATFVAST